MSGSRQRRSSRRAFLATTGKSVVVSSVVAGFPAIVPASVLGPNAPGNQVNVGAIGTGRISRGHDMPGVWKHQGARIVAVCDLDSKRLEEARRLVNGHYAAATGKAYDGVAAYADYRALLASKDVDAVLVSTPDHWHALITLAAVRAGKDVYLQKPASLTIAEGRTLPTRSGGAGASSRSEASSAPRRSSGMRRNSCGTAASGGSRP